MISVGHAAALRTRTVVEKKILLEHRQFTKSHIQQKRGKNSEFLTSSTIVILCCCTRAHVVPMYVNNSNVLCIYILPMYFCDVVPILCMQIIVRSTDVDRTLMSAQCNLAGLYPPEANQSWWPEKANIYWQPIPVHTVPIETDNVRNLQYIARSHDYK